MKQLEDVYTMDMFEADQWLLDLAMGVLL